MKRISIAALIVLVISSLVLGQTASPATKALHERLGYPSEAKLLIVHADDLGMAHSVNAASTKALETGLVSSASIMVPCPWFMEIAAYARKNAKADLGLHLTLTSEWAFYRWGPLLSKERVPTLLNKDGYLHTLENEAAAAMDVREAEAEIRAQIERARAFGIVPTHLDSHMGTLYQSEALFKMFLRVARENQLPIRISRDRFPQAAFIASALTPDDVVLDRIIDIGPDVKPDQWAAFYTEAVKSLGPGVTELVVHLAYDDEEMRGVTFEHPAWGSAWRQRDFDFFTSDAFKRLLAEHNVKLITWREVGKLLQRP